MSNIFHFRVYNKNDDFVSSAYTLSLQAYGKTPARMTIVFNGDMGNTIPAYEQGTYHRFENVLKPMVIIEDASGYPIIGANVYLYWRSGSRSESAGMNEMWDQAETDKDGIATFYTVPFHAIGIYTWEGSGFRHYYDIDDLTYICGDLTISQKVYHLWRSEPIQ